MTPPQVFACVAGLVGIVLVVFTPPFEVPDEPNHFARAFQVSEGQLVSQRVANSVGGWLPRSIDQVADTVMGRVPFNPDVKQDLDAWARAFDIPLLPHDRIETVFIKTIDTAEIDSINDKAVRRFRNKRPEAAVEKIYICHHDVFRVGKTQ